MSIKSPPLQPGFFYHIYSRGINRENIFIEERNYAYFLDLYIHHIAPVANTYAYCLLRNHFHLLVRIHEETKLFEPQGHEVKQQIPESKANTNPSQAFSNFLNAYAKAINKAYGRTGSLFQGRFGRQVIAHPAYFQNVIVYIHRNPEHHKFINDFRDWPYSSYHSLLAEAETQLNQSEVLKWFGNRREYEAYHTNNLALQPIASLLADDLE